MRKKVKKSKSKKLLKFAFLMVSLCVLLLAYLWVWPLRSSGERVLVNVESGASAKSIADQLEQKQVVQSKWAFLLYSRITGASAKIKAGSYALSQNMSVLEMTRMMVEGRTTMVKVTIPEGKTSWEIFSLAHKKFDNLDSNTWEQLVHDGAYAKSLGIQAESLEGYLLPDTYYFPAEATERTIISLFVGNFKEAWAKVKSENPDDKIKQYGMNGVITMASIVEREAGVPEERPRIAGVFYNRLLQNMPLGADPTVRFIFRTLTGPIYKSQLQSDNPYNTRKFTGLPPGPIANPGKLALAAALKPMNTQDLFFVAKEDGTHTHFFAVEYKDFLRDKDVAYERRKAKGLED